MPLNLKGGCRRCSRLVEVVEGELVEGGRGRTGRGCCRGWVLWVRKQEPLQVDGPLGSKGRRYVLRRRSKRCSSLARAFVDDLYCSSCVLLDQQRPCAPLTCQAPRSSRRRGFDGEIGRWLHQCWPLRWRRRRADRRRTRRWGRAPLARRHLDPRCQRHDALRRLLHAGDLLCREKSADRALDVRGRGSCPQHCQPRQPSTRNALDGDGAALACLVEVSVAPPPLASAQSGPFFSSIIHVRPFWRAVFAAPPLIRRPAAVKRPQRQQDGLVAGGATVLGHAGAAQLQELSPRGQRQGSRHRKKASRSSV